MPDPSELDEGKQLVCPGCGQRFYLKPPYNRADECMRCRWEREHPPTVGPTEDAEGNNVTGGG